MPVYQINPDDRAVLLTLWETANIFSKRHLRKLKPEERRAARNETFQKVFRRRGGAADRVSASLDSLAQQGLVTPSGTGDVLLTEKGCLVVGMTRIGHGER